jgi:uncharacterized iron-regulated protein
MTLQHLPTLLKRLTILLVIGVSLGCTELAPQPQPQPIRNIAARLQALPPLDALLLGEQHDNPDHQRIHRQVIEALAQRGALSAVVLEMASQGGSTQGLTPQASEDQARAALNWDEKAWPWLPYAPPIMAAIRAGVPVLGANLPRGQMKQAMAQADLDGRLNGPALKAQQQLIRSGHCDLLPEHQIQPMTRIQIARDVAMAATLVQAVAISAKTGNTGKTVVLMAGNGHVDKTLGIPQHLPAELRLNSVLYGSGQAQTATETIANFDLSWPALPVAPKDYCAELKVRMAG